MNVKRGPKPKQAVALSTTKPTAPNYLGKSARIEYAGLVEVLDQAGTLGQTDPKLIELYAVNYDILVRSYLALAKQELTLEVGNGRMFINPLIGAIHNSTQKLRQVIADFGLSPVAAKLIEARLPQSADVEAWEGSAVQGDF